MTVRTYPFDPDWVVSPGETLQEWLEENGLGGIGQKVAGRHGIKPRTFNRIITGTQPISPTIAAKLECLTFISARVWLALEHNFRVGLAAGKTWVRS